MVPCFPLLGLTPSGLFMGLSSTIIYTSELILCSTICVPSATRHNIHMKANRAEVKRRDSSSSDSDCTGLMMNHMMSASCSSPVKDWIVDSGATCHMCNDDKLFVELRSLKQPLEVTLGDGCAVEATGQGTVVLEMASTSGKTSRCKLHEVLYVPDLSYNLLSVSKAAEAGKVVEFGEISCRILHANRKLITTATRVGNLYYLNCLTDRQQANAADKRNQQTKGGI